MEVPGACWYAKTFVPTKGRYPIEFFNDGRTYGNAFPYLLRGMFSNIAKHPDQQTYDCFNTLNGNDYEARTVSACSLYANLLPASQQGCFRRENIVQHIEKVQAMAGFIIGHRFRVEEDRFHTIIGYIPSEMVEKSEITKISLADLYAYLNITDETLNKLATRYEGKREVLVRII